MTATPDRAGTCDPTPCPETQGQEPNTLPMQVVELSNVLLDTAKISTILSDGIASFQAALVVQASALADAFELLRVDTSALSEGAAAGQPDAIERILRTLFTESDESTALCHSQIVGHYQALCSIIEKEDKQIDRHKSMQMLVAGIKESSDEAAALLCTFRSARNPDGAIASPSVVQKLLLAETIAENLEAGSRRAESALVQYKSVQATTSGFVELILQLFHRIDLLLTEISDIATDGTGSNLSRNDLADIADSCRALTESLAHFQTSIRNVIAQLNDVLTRLTASLTEDAERCKRQHQAIQVRLSDLGVGA